ncbi:MAG: ABC transporter ATP-binding protein [Pseudomonadota bacterium]
MVVPPIARIEHLRVTFAPRPGAGGSTLAAVEDLSFDIAAGETVCLVGESGSGKSVTALALMRLAEFDGGRTGPGRILWRADTGETADLSTRADTSWRGREIGMIFQEPSTALNPVLSIGRQLTEGLRRHDGLSHRAARARAIAVLRQVRLSNPEQRLRQYPHELSGGMRQRVMIAMALACRPRLLIADEPTTALDVTIQAEILALLRRLQAETGTAILFITHDMGVVAEMADRVVVMRAGRKVEEGPVAQIFSRPGAAYTRALLAAVPRVGGTPHGPVADGAAPPLLKVERLDTRYPVRGGLWRRVVGEVHAVRDVSFSLGQGRTLALVGESGSGKSTLGRSVLRLTEPRAGRVLFQGRDITALAPAALRTARQAMQIVFQDPYASLDPRQRLVKQVTEPMRNFSLAQGAEAEDRAAHLFDRVGLSRDLLRRFPHALSGGQRQRVAIARALAVSPALIVADEPVSALDVSVQAQVLELLRDLQDGLGMSYLFISHDMGVVDQMAHEVAVMYLGRIVEIGPRDAVLRDPRHAYTRALLSAIPVPDPAQRQKRELNFSAVASPIYPRGHVSEPPTYTHVGSDHYVLDAGHDA